MEWDPATTILGVALMTSAGGGLWFVIRLIVKFQHNYTDVYVAENSKLKGEIMARDHSIDALRRDLLNAHLERGALRALVRGQGIPWNPSDWGMDDDERAAQV